MEPDRRLWLWRQAVDRAEGTPVTIQHVLAVMIAVTGMDRGTVTVTLRTGNRETLHASDALAADLAELVLTLGEGPGVEARVGGPVLVPDLASDERWPAFAAAAVLNGARAAYALPLQIGGIRLGVIDLYRGQPGRLEQAQVDDALILADMVCALLIDSANDNYPSPNGQGPERARLQHPEVHQATGMVIVQLGVSAAVALVRIRAYAYAHDRRLRDVARDVVARRLRFRPESDDGD
jgi:GAF domain-containing protein